MSCSGSIETRRTPPAGALASAVRTRRFLSPVAFPAKVRDVPSARVASKTNAPGPLPGRSTPALRYLPVLTVISSPAESLVSFQVQSADSLQNPRGRPRSTWPTPRHEPTRGAYAFSASWSARGPARPYPCRRQPAP